MVFALDVGTRFLVGVLAEYDENENLQIKEFSIREHENRAMIDGQIHDVHKVSRGVERIKKELEEKIGSEITDVSVALAGRFLVTSLGEAAIENPGRMIDNDFVKKLELEAVKNATEKMSEYSGMYCVGYSVLYYELDGEWIKKLEGQKGENAYVKVISAFLPKNVVEAMISVLDMNKLTPVHITLEPIAAMNLVVPEDLRNLNIVMVDVGAGTSDIAISKDGTIVGYGMVPMAGDELTEAISKTLLVDFHTAESIKRDLNNKDSFTYKDILDFEQEISKEEIQNIVNPIIEEITTKVSEKVLELNGKPPVAVMVVGGGGKVPGFREKLAEKLGLPNNRVALKELKALNYVKLGKEGFEGPEFITPAAIAYMTLRNEGNVFGGVTVNGKAINMMMIGTDLTVMQVLLQSGINLNQLIGKPSPAVTFELDGEFGIRKGNIGREASIKINGEPVSLKTKVKPGDNIEVGTAQNGEPLILKIADIVPPVEFYINGEKKTSYPKVYRGNNQIGLDVQVLDGDKFTTKAPVMNEIVDTIKKSIYFTLNNQSYEIPTGMLITKNSQIVDGDYQIKSGDRFETEEVEAPLIKEFIEKDLKKMFINFNDKRIELPAQEIVIKNGNKVIGINEPIREGGVYSFETVQKNPTLLDLFTYLSIDTRKIRSYELFIDGEKVESFIQPLNENSVVRFNYK